MTADRSRPPPAGPQIRWVAAAWFAREQDARLLAGRLQAEGVEAQVYPEFQGGYYGESVNVAVQVMVPEHRLIEARDVVERLEQS